MTTDRANQGPSLWEADQYDLQSYVDKRLSVDGGTSAEPIWFAAHFDASWPLAFADAAMWDS
jgi:hypothetical protein